MDEIKHNDANDANKLVEQSSSNIESNATSRYVVYFYYY